MKPLFYSAVRHSNYIARDYKCPCGKDTYLTYEHAAKALKIRESRERNKAIYKCHICGHYHLTTKDGKDRRPVAYSRSAYRENIHQTRLFLEEKKVMHIVRSKANSNKERRYIISMNIDVEFEF